MFDLIVSAFKQYVVLNGRTSRQDFWRFLFGYHMVLFILNAICIWITSQSYLSHSNGVYINFPKHPQLSIDLSLLILAWLLAFFIPTLAITVRRLHDSNKPGWLIPLLILPTAAVAAFLYFSWWQERGWLNHLPIYISQWIAVAGLLLPLLAVIILLTLCCLTGTPNDNRYGKPTALKGSKYWRMACIFSLLLLLANSTMIILIFAPGSS